MSGYSVDLPYASRGHKDQLWVAAVIRCRITYGYTQPDATPAQKPTQHNPKGVG